MLVKVEYLLNQKFTAHRDRKLIKPRAQSWKRNRFEFQDRSQLKALSHGLPESDRTLKPIFGVYGPYSMENFLARQITSSRCHHVTCRDILAKILNNLKGLLLDNVTASLDDRLSEAFIMNQGTVRVADNHIDFLVAYIALFQIQNQATSELN